MAMISAAGLISAATMIDSTARTMEKTSAARGETMPDGSGRCGWLIRSISMSR